MADVFDYIERFHNHRRRYSTLGNLRPVEFEKQSLLYEKSGSKPNQLDGSKNLWL